jgi:hypothetical protein
LNAEPPPSPFTPPRPNIMPIIHKSMESIVLSEMFPFERLELALGTIPSDDRDCTSRIEKTAHCSPLYEFSEPQRGCAEGKRSVRLLRNREYLSPPCGLRNESALTYKRFAGPELTPTVSCSPRVSYSRMLNSPVDTRAAGSATPIRDARSRVPEHVGLLQLLGSDQGAKTSLDMVCIRRIAHHKGRMCVEE